MSYLPTCPPIKYSPNKNLTNYSFNNPGSLETKKSIYSNIIQQHIGKKGFSKLNFAKLNINPFGRTSGSNGGSNTFIKNTFG